MGFLGKKNDPRPDPTIWRDVVAVRCKACAKAGDTPGLLAFLARPRAELPPGKSYLGSGGYDSALHPSVVIEGEWCLYRPTRDEWCLHTVRRHNLWPSARANAGIGHQTVSTLSLPYNNAECQRCHRVAALNRDELASRKAQPLMGILA
jgi:hypothetical protein